MPIDRGLVRPGATVQRDSDKLSATVQGVALDRVQLRPSGQAPVAHRQQHSAKQRQPSGVVYSHQPQLEVPMVEFLATWSSPGLKACNHPGILVTKPMRCPYCGATLRP
jgi:hypothetical protein